MRKNDVDLKGKIFENKPKVDKSLKAKHAELFDLGTGFKGKPHWYAKHKKKKQKGTKKKIESKIGALMKNHSKGGGVKRVEDMIDSMLNPKADL